MFGISCWRVVDANCIGGGTCRPVASSLEGAARKRFCALLRKPQRCDDTYLHPGPALQDVPIVSIVYNVYIAVINIKVTVTKIKGLI